MEQAQLRVHQQFHQSVEVFGAVGQAYANAADDMANKKHDLQKQLIDKTTEQWIKEHQDENGKIDTSALITMLAQRDSALEQAVASRQVWTKVTDEFRNALAELVATSKLVYQKDVDVAEVKERVQNVTNSVLNLIGGIGVGAGVAAGL